VVRLAALDCTLRIVDSAGPAVRQSLDFERRLAKPP
jgi:hypothetical protein